jgi:hypothetical protein
MASVRRGSVLLACRGRRAAEDAHRYLALLHIGHGDLHRQHIVHVYLHFHLRSAASRDAIPYLYCRFFSPICSIAECVGELRCLPYLEVLGVLDYKIPSSIAPEMPPSFTTFHHEIPRPQLDFFYYSGSKIRRGGFSEISRKGRKKK